MPLSATPGTDNVLVVDDDPDVRRALQTSLRRIGCVVTLAENGEEGLRMATEGKPQAIILDIRMPAMDGHTFLRRLATHRLDAGVIVISGSDGMDDVVDVMRQGAVDYLHKPWGPSELIAAVHRAVDIHDQRRRARQAEANPAADPVASGNRPKVVSPLFTSILDEIRTGAVTLPAIPTVLASLREELKDPEAAIADLVKLIEQDPKVAAQILRIANSAHYGRGGSDQGVASAVKRIGLRQVQSTVETLILRETYRVGPPQLAALQKRILHHSLAQAVVMRGLAELMGPSGQTDPEVAYVAGLLSDVGASFLVWLQAERYVRNNQPYEVSQVVAGIQAQHQEVGESLLKQWGVGNVAAHIALTHHADLPPIPQGNYFSLAILALPLTQVLDGGDDLTRRSQPNRELVERCGADLRISVAVAEKILPSVTKEFEELNRALEF